MAFGFGFGFGRASGDHFSDVSLRYDFANGVYFPALNLTVSNSGGLAETTSGSWASFGANTARITDKGLLVEEARTRLNTYPRDLTNAAWTKGAGASAALNAVGIDGTASSASTVTLTATDATGLASYTQTVIAETEYTLSFFHKAGTATGPKYAVYDNSNAAFITAATGYTPGASFTRLTHTFTTPAGCTEVLLQPVTTPTGTGTIVIDAVQLEAGAFATSPIFGTDASPLARSMDSVIVSDLSFINNAAGTVYARYTVGQLEGDFQAFYMDTGGYGNSIQNMFNAGQEKARGYIRESASGEFGEAVGPTVAVGEESKGALTYAANDAIFAGNGTLSSRDTSVTLPSPISEARFGARNSTTEIINGYIADVAYWPSRKPDGFLATITE